ncbi:MAG TPA: DM13 domain-containing protein [Pseudonocardiaceae bacterium]|nr:DM13 domain-containing protein [Pseudonocardiaceae bacterium]
MPNLAARRRTWLVVVLLCAITVGAALGAALVGLAARDGTPPDTQLRPPPTTEQPVPSSFSETPPAGAIVELSAEFDSLDASTSGHAELLRVGGAGVVRLTAFETAAGLGCVVYLVPHADARSPGDGTLLGPLKGATGDQNYPVPVGARTDGPLTVLIWSRGFKGPVAHAVLRR